MPIHFQCENTGCGGQLRVPDTASGKRAKCPRCGHVQVVVSDPTGVPTPVVAEVVEDNSHQDRGAHEPGRRRAVRSETEFEDEGDERPRRRRHEEGDEDDYDQSSRGRGRGYREEELDCPRCAGPITLESQECQKCEYELDPEAMKAELRRLRWVRSLFQGLMFLFVMPGLLMIAAGVVLYFSDYPTIPWVVGLVLGGTALLVLGTALGAIHKFFNLAWLLLGLAGPLGLIVLACIPDEKRQRSRRIRQFLRAQWDAEGHADGSEPPWDVSSFPFTLLFGLLGVFAASGVIAVFYQLFTK